jgi:hypothetical protein
MKRLALLVLTALLGACGGGSGSMPAAGSTTPPAPTVMTDAFVATMQPLVATAPEDGEPTAVDSVVLTMPENTEPEPVN